MRYGHKTGSAKDNMFKKNTNPYYIEEVAVCL